jgi:hypothetical protein
MLLIVPKFWNIWAVLNLGGDEFLVSYGAIMAFAGHDANTGKKKIPTIFLIS